MSVIAKDSPTVLRGHSSVVRPYRERAKALEIRAITIVEFSYIVGVVSIFWQHSQLHRCIPESREGSRESREPAFLE